jgi:hypothetical protein
MMNLLVGRGSGRLELGAGRVFGSLDSYDGSDILRSGAYTATIGFRYQPAVRRGLVFRAGLTPFYEPTAEHDDRVWLWFGVSLGQAF